jgi:hypothetical protein
MILLVSAVAARRLSWVARAGSRSRGPRIKPSSGTASAAKAPAERAASRTAAGSSVPTPGAFDADEAAGEGRGIADDGPLPSERLGGLQRHLPQRTPFSPSRDHGQSHRDQRGWGHVPPPASGLTPEPLLLEGTQEDRVLGSDGGLVLDGAAEGEHGVLRQHQGSEVGQGLPERGQHRRSGHTGPGPGPGQGGLEGRASQPLFEDFIEGEEVLLGIAPVPAG